MIPGPTCVMCCTVCRRCATHSSTNCCHIAGRQLKPELPIAVKVGRPDAHEGGAAALVATGAPAGSRWRPNGQGHRLHAGTLDRADAAPGRRRGRHRQQPSGAPDQAVGDGAPGMDVRGQRTGRPTDGHRDEPCAVGANERTRSCSAASAGAAAHRTGRPSRIEDLLPHRWQPACSAAP